MKDMDAVKSYEERNKEKWDRINRDKRRDIALGQAINLAESIAGRTFDGNMDKHINKMFRIVPDLHQKIMKAYDELKDDVNE